MDVAFVFTVDFEHKPFAQLMQRKKKLNHEH